MFKTVNDLGGYHQVSIKLEYPNDLQKTKFENINCPASPLGHLPSAVEAGLQRPGRKPAKHQRGDLHSQALWAVSTHAPFSRL